MENFLIQKLFVTKAQTWSHHEEAVVFGFGTQVLKDDLLQELLHQIPVFHHPMPDRPLQDRAALYHLLTPLQTSSSSCSCSYFGCIVGFVDSFVPDVKVKVVHSPSDPSLRLLPHTGRLLNGNAWGKL